MATTIGSAAELPRGLAASRKRGSVIRKALFACGIGYGFAYVVANDVIAAHMVDGYSRLDQAISELSAKGTSSRGFLTAMLPVFSVLVLAFGIGTWWTARHDRALRVIGGILIAQGLLFPLWLFFPMTSREELAQGAGGANDVGHLVLSALAVVFILTEMGLSGVALGRRFGYFSLAMAVITLAGGAYTASTKGAVEAGDPTPWMGLIERIMYGAWLLWMAVLSAVLIRRRDEAGKPPDGTRRDEPVRGRWLHTTAVRGPDPRHATRAGRSPTLSRHEATVDRKLA